MSQEGAPPGYLDDPPSRCELILDLVFGPGDHDSATIPLDPISCTNDDPARIDILETENFLRRERYSIHS